jgi:hypothetical protein
MGQLEAYQNSSELPEQCKGKHEIQDLKAAILDHAHITESTDAKVQNICHC